MRSRWLAQSAVSKPLWTLVAKSSSRPIISCNSVCKRRLIRPRLTLLFQAGEALTEAGNPGLELVLVDEALGIAVNQPGDTLPELADLRFHCGERRVWPASLAATRRYSSASRSG